MHNESVKLERRKWLARSSAACLAVAAGWPQRVPALFASAKGREQAKRPESYIDFHVHLGQPWNERRALTARSLLQWMDQHHVEQAVVLPLVSPEAWFYPISTDWVLEQTRPFRDRLIPFCAIDPRTAVMGGEKPFHDLLRRYQDAGARGFGEHKWGGAIDDPKNIELMQACAEFKLPVLFHLDRDRNWDQPGLPGLIRLLDQVPELALIGHGPGWWASISGDANPADFDGYPKGPVVEGGALDRVLARFPNLYADLSAGSGHNAIRRDLKFGREFLIRHADRILFGSDYLAESQQVEQFLLLQSLELPPQVIEKIYRGNARQLLKIS